MTNAQSAALQSPTRGSFTKNSLPDAVRSAMIELLNQRLADAVDLGTHAKQAHWNASGPNFIGLHQLFDQVHSRVQHHSDSIAERITALGGIAAGTAAVAAEYSHLPRYPVDVVVGTVHVDALSTTLAAFGQSLRGDIDRAADAGDLASSDLLTEVCRDIDKQLWLVEAHLRAKR